MVLAAGQLVHKFFSVARVPVTTQSRFLVTAAPSGHFSGEASGDTDDVEICDNPYKAKSQLWWDSQGLHCRFLMPGLEKEHVKVWIDPESGAVNVRGDGPRQSEDYDRSDVAAWRTYLGSVKPRPGITTSDIHAEMKNGVLSVLVRAEEKGHSSAVEYVKIN